MLTLRVCQALRAYAERKRDVERSQLRAAQMGCRPACVIYVKSGSREPVQPAARGAAPDAPPVTRAQPPAPMADYEPEAG
jgi:hypothetical protein